MLRMEDIDPDRSRPEYADAIIRDLRWLGLDWDEGPDAGGPAGPYVQSARMELYTDALNRLGRAGHIYPCYCTRKELRTLAGAPHVGDAGACLLYQSDAADEEDSVDLGGRRCYQKNSTADEEQQYNYYRQTTASS